MTSIIINSFYRALCKINDFKPIETLNLKELATLLMDELYPEDGYITLEDDPRGSLRVHLDDRFLDRVRDQVAKGLNIKEATEVSGLKAQEEPVPEPVKQEAVVPVAAPVVPEVKEVKVKPAPKPKGPAKPKQTDEEKAAAKAAEKAAKEEAKKAPKPKFVGNIEKLNPTQEKAWKKTASDANVELTDDHKKRFLSELNALDNKVYNQKKLEVHMAEFFVPKVVETKPDECVGVEFNGKEYWVNREGVVYEAQEGSDVDKKVGHVGMLEFKDMQMPSADDFQ
jgi:hypothetical protein